MIFNSCAQLLLLIAPALHFSLVLISRPTPTPKILFAARPNAPAQKLYEIPRPSLSLFALQLLRFSNKGLAADCGEGEQ